MRIAICDDVTKDLRAIVEALGVYLSARNLTAEVAEFPTPELLMAAVRKSAFDLYILDIILSADKTGIDLVRWLRAGQIEAPVVFLSTSREYAFDAFSVDAISYLEKPWTQDAFFRALDRAMESVRHANESLLIFKSGTDVIRLPASQIECVRTSQTVNYVEISRVDGEAITVRGSVKSFFEQYGSHAHLLPAGRSILVNPSQILSFGKSSVRFFSGMTLEVPKSVLPTLSRAVLSLSAPCLPCENTPLRMRGVF